MLVKEMSSQIGFSTKLAVSRPLVGTLVLYSLKLRENILLFATP